MLETKQNQFRQFVDERREKVLRNLPTNDKVSFLSGERKEYVKTNLKILDRYIQNFLNIRQSDIDAQMAEKGDREAVGSRSFAKHMKPNMLAEFDSAWKLVTTYLQHDVFFQSTTKMPKLPVVSGQGEVMYKDVMKEIGKDILVEKSIYPEYMIQKGPVYAQTFVFTKSEPMSVQVTNENSRSRDAWDMYK